MLVLVMTPTNKVLVTVPPCAEERTFEIEVTEFKRAKNRVAFKAPTEIRFDRIDRVTNLPERDLVRT